MLFRSFGFKNMFLGLSKKSMGLLNEPHLWTMESSLACHGILLQFPRFLQQKKGGILKSPSRQKEVLQGFMLRMFCICHKQISSRRPHINYTEKSKGAFFSTATFCQMWNSTRYTRSVSPLSIAFDNALSCSSMLSNMGIRFEDCNS